MARKVHFLRPGLYGLFENLMTVCGAAGQYLRDAAIIHYRTDCRYDYTNDWNKVPCKTCRKKGLTTPPI